MRISLLASLLAFVAAPVLAQDAVVLRPGHPDLMTAGLTLDSETIGIRVVEPAPQDLGTVASTVSRDGDVVTIVTEADAPQATPPAALLLTFRTGTTTSTKST